MLPSYRTIFTEMILAQSAAIGAFADVATHCARLADQQYRQSVTSLARALPAISGVSVPAHPSGESPGGSLVRSATIARAVAGLPRISMMMFLSQYDDLRGRRDLVQN
jgi:hypothetical protein